MEHAGEPAPGTGASEVARAYDRWAATYDTDDNATRDLAAAALRAAALPLEGRAVLEIGCGTGRNTAWLAERARAVVAFDVSAAMLARARAAVSAPHVRFVQHDVCADWPLPRRCVEVVVGSLVLEHVAELRQMYAAAARVLRPGGLLWLCELHPERQRLGVQAHFTAPDSGEVVRIPAHLHTVADYVNGGIEAGLALRRLDERRDPGAAAAAPPRLLAALFAAPG